MPTKRLPSTIPMAVRDLGVLAGVNVVAIEDDVIAMLGA